MKQDQTSECQAESGGITPDLEAIADLDQTISKDTVLLKQYRKKAMELGESEPAKIWWKKAHDITEIIVGNRMELACLLKEPTYYIHDQHGMITGDQA